MKAASAGLAAHLSSGAPLTLATCIEITRSDGQVFRFTDHDRDLTVGGQTYSASRAYTREAVSASADMSVAESEIIVLLDNAAITAADIRAGRWDNAKFRLLLVNWSDTSQGAITLRTGWFGRVQPQDDGTARVELRGLAQALQQQIVRSYAPGCDADLGDTRCGIPTSPPLRANSTAYAVGAFVRVETDTSATGPYREERRIYECTTAGTSAASQPTFSTTINSTTTDGTVTWTARAAWAQPATVSSVVTQASVVLQADGIQAYADGWFDGGLAIWVTGVNAGAVREINGWVQATRTLTLFLSLPAPIAVGDVLRVLPGCDKRFITCRDKFSNWVRFRGFPDVPGAQAALERPV
jgi:uncharacterized phage protein (TIGR02218 family)